MQRAACLALALLTVAAAFAWSAACSAVGTEPALGSFAASTR